MLRISNAVVNQSLDSFIVDIELLIFAYLPSILNSQKTSKNIFFLQGFPQYDVYIFTDSWHVELRYVLLMQELLHLVHIALSRLLLHHRLPYFTIDIQEHQLQ